MVGVVNDVHELGLADREPWESLYVPITQIALPTAQPIFNGGVLLLVRSEVGTNGLVEAVRREIRHYDRSQPIGEVRTMDDVVRRSAAPYHFRTRVVVGFAALALLLAAVGIYGVVSVLAQARRRELAIRRALGSTAAQLVRLVARQGMMPVGCGILLGWAGAVLSARFVQSLLFGVSAMNVDALGVTVLVLVAPAVLAILPPAFKSARMDPMSVLRSE